LEGELDKKLD